MQAILARGALAAGAPGPMDLKQLHRFVVVSELRQLGRAAKQLNLSQPTLSRTIQLLEGEIGVPLFERGPRGLVLTPVGQVLVIHAKVLLNEQGRALAAIKNIAHWRTVIGVSTSFIERITPDAVSRTLRRHPQIRICVVDDVPAVLLRRLADGELDLAFTSSAPGSLDDTLAFEPMIEESVFLVARREHPLHSRTDLTLSDLINERWAVFDSPDFAPSWANIFRGMDSPPPKPALSAASGVLLANCLLKEDLVAMMEQSGIAAHLASGALKPLNIPPRMDSFSGVYYRQTGILSDAAKAFYWGLREACAEDAAAVRSGPRAADRVFRL